MRTELHRRLREAAVDVDVSYPDNADLDIDEAGVPVLRRRRGTARRPQALALERDVLARLPERDLLDVVTRAAYWTGWPRHLGPVSGSDPKIRDAFGRYVLMGFCYGTNVGPAQFARHMPEVSAHQMATAFEHAGVERLHAAHTDVVNAFARLEMPAVWGDGTRAAADGCQIDTWSDNLLAESHIRYGGYGGIAYRLISDTYIALFTRFIPCGVWEANYIIQNLLDNTSDIQPTSVHADTQGQSLPVFGLAFLLGVDLLPRIRNWKDLIFYRPDRTSVYQHVEPLFAQDKTIDWDLIETHWPDLIRVAMSIRAGRLDSVALLRRLGHDSRRNRLYRAFRELGRVMRTIVLLRYLSEPALRDSIAVVTNRMESYNAFCQWVGFGRDVLAVNDPDKQEKIVKLTELVANCLVYSTTVDMTEVVNDMVAEGRRVERQDLATISPYVTSTTRRFGRWQLVLEPPAPVPVALNVPEEPDPEEAPAPAAEDTPPA
jgi:TnpA family transposase